jgi:transposase
LKYLNNLVRDVARKLNVSDTYVHQTFDRYVDMKRLPLTEAICIDEVHTETVSYSRYSMIILDFITGQAIDMLPSRQKRDTSDYFASIPIKERMNVKYLITDMYNSYLAFADTSFFILRRLFGGTFLHARALF